MPLDFSERPRSSFDDDPPVLEEIPVIDLRDLEGRPPAPPSTGQILEYLRTSGGSLHDREMKAAAARIIESWLHR